MTFSSDFWIGLSIGILGILATLAVAWYQRQQPQLAVSFFSPDDSPARLLCRIHNSGRGEARDVAVGFTFMLPRGARLFAAPELGAKLVEADTPPDPTAGPAAAALQRAFAVQLPRIAPGDTVEFELVTDDPDNQRAAAQIVRIRAAIAPIVAEFGTRLSAFNETLGRLWNTELILQGRRKLEAFFTPATLSYERGRQSISVLSEEEELAAAHCQDLYARFKQMFIDIFQGRPDFTAPVIRIKTGSGDRTYATFPPYVNTHLDMAVPQAVLQPGVTLHLYPPVPEIYE
jgi:hypothetical protein